MSNEKQFESESGSEINGIDDTSYEINSFDELDIDSDILRGIYAYGFEKPSPIQKKAIKPIIAGRDIIAQAQSGTGKTATFSIGALSMVDLKENNTQVLVLSPTRELTTQTAKVMSSIGSMMDGLRVQTLFGGSSVEEHSSFLKKTSPHIICGCPGRVYDMIRRDNITTKKIKLIILDEADEMLSSGFKEQVYNIFQYFNNDVQIALFSAMSEDGFPVCCIHSNMDTKERDKAFNDFKSGSCRVLISSNVTSRGIDIQQVSTVINFDIPKDIHTYLHRIGRSGRWGRKGVGINFITRRDVIKLKEIEEYYACQINEMPSNFKFSQN